MRTLIILASGLVLAACYECKSTDPQCRSLPPYEPIGPAPGPGDYPGPDGQVTLEPEDSPAALSSPCGRSCATIRGLSCPEGQPNAAGHSCYKVCVQAATLRRLPTACWASATTQDALRACGAIRCQ